MRSRREECESCGARGDHECIGWLDQAGMDREMNIDDIIEWQETGEWQGG